MTVKCETTFLGIPVWKRTCEPYEVIILNIAAATSPVSRYVTVIDEKRVELHEIIDDRVDHNIYPYTGIQIEWNKNYLRTSKGLIGRRIRYYPTKRK